MPPITCKKSDISESVKPSSFPSATAITGLLPDLSCSPITLNPKGEHLCKTLASGNLNSNEFLMETSIDLTTEDCDTNEAPQKMSPMMMRKFILVPLKLAVPYLLGKRELKKMGSVKDPIEIDLTVELDEEAGSKVNNVKVDASSQCLNECTLSEVCLPPKNHTKRHDLEVDFSIEGEDFKDEPELVSICDISQLAQDSIDPVILKYQGIDDEEMALGSTNVKLKSTSIESEPLAKYGTFERSHVVDAKLKKNTSEDTQKECNDISDLEIKIEYPEPLEEMLKCTTEPDSSERDMEIHLSFEKKENKLQSVTPIFRDTFVQSFHNVNEILEGKRLSSRGQNISHSLFEPEILERSQIETDSSEKISSEITQKDCEKLADMEIKIEYSEPLTGACLSPKSDLSEDNLVVDLSLDKEEYLESEPLVGEKSGLSQNSDIAIVNTLFGNNPCDSETQEAKKNLFGSSKAELNLLPTSANKKKFEVVEMGPSSDIYTSSKECPEPDFEIKIEYPEPLKDSQVYESQYSQITDHKNAKFQCETCPYETDESVHFEVHKKTHRYSYNCPQCLYKTCKKAKLQHHIYCKHTPMEDKLIYCGDCEFTCLTRVGMADHRRKMHKRLPRPPNKCFLERKPKVSTHPCGVCTRSFQTAKGALDHQATHIYSKIESGALKCLTCDFVSARTDMINHYFDVHKKGEKKHRCEKCYYGTNFKSYLTKHFKSHAHMENVRKAQVVQV
ncbi:uncharacterized protein [Euwallacea similis]|uniref:uncharacterized protein n=1 Tax=Euwallacea similis TaxID=1736056 RepID=UPI00344E351A